MREHPQGIDWSYGLSTAAARSFDDSVARRRVQAQAVPLSVGVVTLGAGVLTLIAISCASLGLWRIGADLDQAGGFVLQDGFLSHWQVWIGAAVATQYAGVHLTRYAKTPQSPLNDGATAEIPGAPADDSVAG